MFHSDEATVFSWPSASQFAQEENKVRLIYFTGRIDNPQIFDRPTDRSDRRSLASAIEELYDRHGFACADMLLGDFVIALWDPKQAAVICIRDYIGCENSYYTLTGRRFAIAPTIKELTDLVETDLAIDAPYAVSSLMAFFNHPERTLLRDVRKIPPGHVLTVKPSGVEAQRYWYPENAALVDYSDPEFAHGRFRDLLEQAVVDRLPEDDTLAVHVTGGLDSAAVNIVLSRLLRQQGRPVPLAFSWQPEPGEIVPGKNQTYADFSPVEYDTMHAVSAEAALEPVHCPVRTEDVLEIWQRDERIFPTGGNTYSEWPVQKEAARRKVQFIFSGAGGDDCVSYSGGGYLQGLALSGRWLRLFRYAREANLNPFRLVVANLISGLKHKILPEFVLNGIVKEGGAGVARWKTLLRTVSRQTDGPFLLSKDEIRRCRHMFSYVSPVERLRTRPLPPWISPRKTSIRRAIIDTLQLGHVSQRTESWGQDGRQLGIRYLYPLLDKRLVEFALGLPGSAFRNPQYGRLFFRRAMKPLLPEAVCWEPKIEEYARAEWSLNQIKLALHRFADALDAGEVPTRHQALVDMDRLRDSLSARAIKERDYLARLLFTIQLLGLNKTRNSNRKSGD